jgi:hypothetical protein
MTQDKGDIGTGFPGDERKTRKRGPAGEVVGVERREKSTGLKTRHYEREKQEALPSMLGRPSWKKGLCCC